MAIAAVIGGVGAVASAGIQASAAGTAASAAKSAANASNALETNIFNQNKANIQPYVDRGNSAASLEDAFLGVGGDPAASQAALKNYLNSTGYQFQKDQGVSAITQGKATAGLLNSGSTLKSLDAYGTGLANSFGQQYVGNLQGISNEGAGAASSLAGSGQAFANSVSSNNNNAAAATGNAALSSANSLTGAIGQALSAYGTYRGLSSFAPSQTSNAFTPQTDLNSGGI